MPKNLAEVQAELTRIAAYARNLVGQALTRGTITHEQHDAYVRNLTETNGVTRVLIELELEDADVLSGRADLNEQVERALSGLARQAGARVVSGSVNVTLDSIDPDTTDGYTEDPTDELDDEPEEPTESPVAPTYATTPGDRGVTITITTRLAGAGAMPGNTADVSRAVERALTVLGQQQGIAVVPGSTEVRVTGQDVRITQRATGNVHLAAHGAGRVEDSLAALGREYDLRLVSGSTRVQV